MTKKQTCLNSLEVLSPAGNAESFYAAINNGADAIYLGIDEFNARMRAQNFTKENIREFVKLAHGYGVKIYVTINILFEDDDFEKLTTLVEVLTDAKVDAFIVQDLGVAHFLKNTFVGINLHASTQMGIHNLYGAKIAEQLGFSRIVLSRETSLEDIKEIHENTNLEIEYFVQGALCVAFSGNCYLSSIEQGMSGNEGKCLQLCRLPYTNNLNGETNYVLSPRDLSLLENLETLIEAGVTSFKIEGRMRHPGYVATATNVYKNAISKIKAQKFNKKFIDESTKILKTSYSRGEFNTNAYLTKDTKNRVIFKDYQNHIGTKIGIVKKVEPFKNDLFKITISSSHPLADGDGLKIIDSKTKKQISSLGVGGVQKLENNTFVFYTKSKFQSGLDVHLTQNSVSEEKLLKNSRKIKINIKIIANFGKKLKVFAKNDFAKIYFESKENLEKAKNNPLTEDDFKTQFSKLSETNFEVNKFEIQTNGVFLPKSMLNGIRREMVQKLEDETLLANEGHIYAFLNSENLENIMHENIVSTPTNLEIIRDCNHSFNSKITYVFEFVDFSNVDALELLKHINPEQLAISIPTIMSKSDRIVFEKTLKQFPKTISLYANNIGALEYANQGYKIIVSPLMNVKNKFTIKCLNNLNVTTICASVETSKDFAENYSLISFESGVFPLMTFAHCPYKVVNGNTCANCSYSENLEYKSDSKQTYKIKRIKLANCYFTMNKQLSREKTTFNIRNFND